MEELSGVNGHREKKIVANSIQISFLDEKLKIPDAYPSFFFFFFKFKQFFFICQS